MLTVKQAAERLRVSPSLVYSLIAARELAHVRIGFGRGLIRISEESICEYEQRRSVSVAEPTPAPAPRRRAALKHLDL
jgi:excisionase family DNA binding protein